MTDNALFQCLAEIRRGLGDYGMGQRLIRHRHGVKLPLVAKATAEQEEIALVERAR